MAGPIYLDHHATTPVDPRVLDAMLPCFIEHFGNPSSLDHRHGAKANDLVKIAREQVARLIGARDPDEIIFTSGATESDNMALRGVLRPGDHLVTTAVEHKAILETCADLERQGIEVTYVGVDEQGLLSADDIEAALRPTTKLISVMAANNEMGAVYPLDAIGAVAMQAGVLFHVDAAQACGHVPVDVEATHIDLLSLSAHKMYGPKGVGALYIRQPNRRVRVKPMFAGGGQERNIRSGTHNVPAIVGLGEATKIAACEMAEEAKRLAAMRGMLYETILDLHPDASLIGPPPDGPRLPHNLMVSFAPFKARALLRQLADHVSLSTGSACQTDRTEASHVLTAMGRGGEARYALRFGLGRGTTAEDIQLTGNAVKAAIRPLRGLAA